MKHSRVGTLIKRIRNSSIYTTRTRTSTKTRTSRQNRSNNRIVRTFRNTSRLFTTNITPNLLRTFTRRRRQARHTSLRRHIFTTRTLVLTRLHRHHTPNLHPITKRRQVDRGRPPQGLTKRLRRVTHSLVQDDRRMEHLSDILRAFNRTARADTITRMGRQTHTRQRLVIHQIMELRPRILPNVFLRMVARVLHYRTLARVIQMNSRHQPIRRQRTIHNMIDRNSRLFTRAQRQFRGLPATKHHTTRQR